MNAPYIVCYMQAKLIMCEQIINHELTRHVYYHKDSIYNVVETFIMGITGTTQCFTTRDYESFILAVLFK